MKWVASVNKDDKPMFTEIKKEVAPLASTLKDARRYL